MDGIAPTRLDALDPAHCARIDYNLCAPPLFTPSKDTRFKRQILQFATRGAEQVAGRLSKRRGGDPGRAGAPGRRGSGAGRRPGVPPAQGGRPRPEPGGEGATGGPAWSDQAA